MPRVEVVQRFLLRESLRRLAETERAARELHQVLGVALVHDGEVRGEAGRRAELSEQAMPDGVKGAAVHPRAGGADESLGAGEHLAGGAAREGEEEDALRRDAALDQVRDAVDERARLARAGAGDDEQRPVAEGDGALLLRVERGGERRLVRGGKLSRARAVEARLVRHPSEYRSAPERR